MTAQKFFFSSHAHQTTTEKRKRKEGQKTTEKRITSDGFVCRSSRRRRRQGYENLYTGFLLTFLPSFVFLRVTRFTDVLSLSFFYFRTHRRERFSRRSARSATSQNRGEDTNRYESVFSSSSFLREALECLRGKGNKDVRAVSVDRAIRSGRPGRAFFAIGFVFDSIDFGCSPCKVKRYRVSLVAAEREARDLYNDENSHTFYSVYY